MEASERATHGGRSNTEGSLSASVGFCRASGWSMPDVTVTGTSSFSELPIPGNGTFTTRTYWILGFR